VELRGQPREASWMLTFSFEQSPSAYSTYRNAMMSLIYFSMHVFLVHYV
jgi:hypothetical protein